MTASVPQPSQICQWPQNTTNVKIVFASPCSSLSCYGRVCSKQGSSSVTSAFCFNTQHSSPHCSVGNSCDCDIQSSSLHIFSFKIIFFFPPTGCNHHSLFPFFVCCFFFSSLEKASSAERNGTGLLHNQMDSRLPEPSRRI